MLHVPNDCYRAKGGSEGGAGVARALPLFTGPLQFR